MSRQSSPIVLAPAGAKGGTLKSSIMSALAYMLASLGFRAVLVDADPQASLTLASECDRVADPLTAPLVEISYRLPADEVGTREIVKTRGSVGLLCGGRGLEGASPLTMASLLTRAAQPVAGGRPDFILVDTPPSLGPITQEAMRSAHLILLPTDPTAIGLRGAADVVALHQQLELAAPIRGLLTKVSGHTKDLNDMVRSAFDHEPPFSTIPGLRSPVEIPFTRRGAESGAYCLPVNVSAPDDRASLAYRRLLRDVRSILGFPLSGSTRRQGRES